jgi:DNA-binding GntR family transcriptional regulator
LLNDVFEQIYLRYRPEYLGKGRIRESDLEHRAILKSLGKGDTTEATALIKDHIWKGMDGIIRNIPTEKNMVFYEIGGMHQR